eukprot:scaffold382960_cov18-Prasinocladus_malaysianus.AAC.1
MATVITVALKAKFCHMFKVILAEKGSHAICNARALVRRANKSEAIDTADSEANMHKLYT